MAKLWKHSLFFLSFIKYLLVGCTHLEGYLFPQDKEDWKPAWKENAQFGAYTSTHASISLFRPGENTHFFALVHSGIAFFKKACQMHRRCSGWGELILSVAPNLHGRRDTALGPAATGGAQCFGNNSYRECDFSKYFWVRMIRLNFSQCQKWQEHCGSGSGWHSVWGHGRWDPKAGLDWAAHKSQQGGNTGRAAGRLDLCS